MSERKCTSCGITSKDASITDAGQCEDALECARDVADILLQRAEKAEARVRALEEALTTVERTGESLGRIVAQRSDGHACGWCRGMLTPCPVQVARAALARKEQT